MGEISGIFFGMSVDVSIEVTSLILEKVSIKKKSPTQGRTISADSVFILGM